MDIPAGKWLERRLMTIKETSLAGVVYTDRRGHVSNAV